MWYTKGYRCGVPPRCSQHPGAWPLAVLELSTVSTIPGSSSSFPLLPQSTTLSCEWCSTNIQNNAIFYCFSCRRRYCSRCLVVTDDGCRCPACLEFVSTYDSSPHFTSSAHRAQRRRRKELSKGVRFQVLERDEFLCQYCGEGATTVDHLVPWAYGGSDALSNLKASCLVCNLLAGNSVFETFELKRAFILKRRKEKRIEARRRYSICIECLDVYAYGERGSTMFHCPSCDRKDLRVRKKSGWRKVDRS